MLITALIAWPIASIPLGFLVARAFPKSEDDSPDEGAETWHVAILCDCDLNLPVCDERGCKHSTPAPFPCVGQRGAAIERIGGPASCSVSSFHMPGDKA